MTTRILPPLTGQPSPDPVGLRLRLEFAKLQMLRGFEELLCLEGLRGVEHLPHQVETVRKVLRHFRGRALLADEVGLGKTIEACLLLREYLLRAIVKRALILVPAALVGQWREELSAKFGLEFSVPGASAGAGFWSGNNLVLASISMAKGRRHFEHVTACQWDLVIVDEAHHCKNRATLNWQLVNALRRRYLFLLTATPVQNDLLELYNLLTLLEPGHLKTEKVFRKTYIRRGAPRDPLNRHNLRSLLGEVMVRNTRSLVNINLPRRYAQTFVLSPEPDEAQLYSGLDSYLRNSRSPAKCAPVAEINHAETGAGETSSLPPPEFPENCEAVPDSPGLARMRLNSLLLAAGAIRGLAASLERMTASADRAAVHGTCPAAGFVRKGAQAPELRTKPRSARRLSANFRRHLPGLAALTPRHRFPFFRQRYGAEKNRLLKISLKYACHAVRRIRRRSHNLHSPIRLSILTCPESNAHRTAYGRPIVSARRSVYFQPLHRRLYGRADSPHIGRQNHVRTCDRRGRLNTRQSRRRRRF